MAILAYIICKEDRSYPIWGLIPPMKGKQILQNDQWVLKRKKKVQCKILFFCLKSYKKKLDYI